jgi:hypothetical protein
MTLKFRYLLAAAAACCFSAPAEAGPVAAYLRASSKGRAEAAFAVPDPCFQAWFSDPSPLVFDRDGTIRNAAGRPVGWWGIDGRQAAALRR